VLAYTFIGCDGGWSYRSTRRRGCPQLTSGRRSGLCWAFWPKQLEQSWCETLCREPHWTP